MSKSYDLSTSTKWANLADGDHVVKLRAKGAGYGTSSFSNSVTVRKGATGETWVLNEALNSTVLAKTMVNFISDGIRQFTGLKYQGGVISELLYYTNDSDYEQVYSKPAAESPWADDSYRTITFATAPTGNLLTWLQANGTKQGGGN